MQKRATVLLTLLFSFFIKTKAECVLVPLSLQERVNASTLIVEAQITGKYSYWNAEKNMIFTANTISVSKIYKGAHLLTSYNLDIITLGGLVGNNAIKVDPELELVHGDIGIFLLVQKNGEWVAESGPQGFIKIDKVDATASDIFNKYAAYTISSKIESITNNKVLNVNPELTRVLVSGKRAACTISSFSPSSLSAGTSSVLTIKGTNFKATRDTSYVQFKNGDDGGISYIKALQLDYISWSDTMIRVKVTTKAGTGKIRVVIGDNGNAISSDTLKITYSHLNVISGYKRDSISYETQEIGMNGSGGVSWQMSTRFYDSIGARGAFVRSLERWRCGTFINWDTTKTVNYNTIKSDGVNMCAWDTSGVMANGVLAQCFSYWSGCYTPGLKYFVNELDIRFRVRPTNSTNWNYTTGNAAGNQFHFESVAVHELGHGHQMGHVIAPAVVMHYSIANGQTKPSLSTSDIDAGNYVITKSGTVVCGKNKHTKLNSGTCAIVASKANFGASKNAVCLNENVVFTDSSKGNITVYSWNFGTGASPSTAITLGPHTVSYSSGGNKTISLNVTTLNGVLTKTMNINVANDSRMKPNFNWVAAEKGKVSFTNTSNNAITNKWYFGNGDSSTSTNPTYTYTAGRTYNVKLKATNTCNTEDTIIPIKFAYLNFYVTPKNACIGQPVTYTDSSDNNVASGAWSFPSASPNSANNIGPHTVIYNTPGLKNATLIIQVTGGKAQGYGISDAVNISTDTFAKANFTYDNYGNNVIKFNNTSTGSNKTYKWYFGDGDSSTLANPLHQYTNANNKTVKLVVKGTCNTNEITIQLRDFTGISKLNTENIFEIYPSPSNTNFTVKSKLNGILQVTVLDILGKTITTETIKNGNTIDCSQWANGIYMVKLKTNNIEQTVKIMVQH